MKVGRKVGRWVGRQVGPVCVCMKTLSMYLCICVCVCQYFYLVPICLSVCLPACLPTINVFNHNLSSDHSIHTTRVFHSQSDLRMNNIALVLDCLHCPTLSCYKCFVWTLTSPIHQFTHTHTGTCTPYEMVLSVIRNSPQRLDLPQQRLDYPTVYYNGVLRITILQQIIQEFHGHV